MSCGITIQALRYVIYILHEHGLEVKILGEDAEKGESLQVVVPANSWFGAKVKIEDSYTLSSCTVAPGFDFSDFSLAERGSLVKQFPEYGNIIKMLTV